MTICPLDFAKKIIACPSVTPVEGGAQLLLGKTFENMGFSCHPMVFGQVPNLFARLGDAGPHMCFAGHTDVVPPGPAERWTSPPFAPEVRDGILYGRGASDMKGPIAAFVAAVSRYLDKHGAPPGSISLMITGDEEGPALDGTAKVLEWAQRAGQLPDVCIVGECVCPERIGQEIKVGRRGSLTAHLAVQGKQCHVAFPDRGRNPVPDLVALLAALHQVEWEPGGPPPEPFPPTNFQVTELSAGVGADNVIPPEARATLKIRFAPTWTGQALEARIRQALDAVGAAYTLDVTVGSSAFLTEPGPWRELVAAAVEDVMGEAPARTCSGGTSDAKYIHRYCPVVECGSVGASAHQIDEHIAVDDLETLTRTYLRVLERYFLES